MKKIEWFREMITAFPTSEALQQRQAAGWRPVAIEWEREVSLEESSQGVPKPGDEIPYGMRIGEDCRHLEENAAEMEVLRALAEMVVQDLSFPRMADMLNLRNFHTRDGRAWTAVDVFKLTPRLIDITPRILSGSEWEQRKKQLSRVAWNS